MTTRDRGNARGAARTPEVRALLARFRQGKDAAERAAFWSSRGADLGEAVAGALADSIAERVQEAVERTAEGDDELAVRAISRALRDRACLESARAAFASPTLTSHLAALDERLAEHEDIVDLLDDDEYLDAVGDEPVDERTWWGRRMTLIRALPMNVLVHHLRQAAPRRGATRPSRPLRDLFAELDAWSADAADPLAAASTARAAAGAPPQFEYLPVARRARFAHRTVDVWLARVGGQLHVRLVGAGGEPDAPALVLPDGSTRRLAPADVDAIFRLPITRTIPELAQGDWFAAGAYDGPLAEGFSLSLRGGEASVDLRVAGAAPDHATEADEEAIEALSCAHDGRWTQLVLAASRIDAAPDESLRATVAIHLAALAASADLARRTRAYLTRDVWERLADRPWLGAPLRNALRSA